MPRHTGCHLNPFTFSHFSGALALLTSTAQKYELSVYIQPATECVLTKDLNLASPQQRSSSRWVQTYAPSLKIRAAHVLCADAEAAEAALARIKAGEQFGDVAADMSSCPSKDKGGDLGWFKKGQMVAEFEAACFENDPGTIVKVQTQFGWHVVSDR